MDMPVYDERTFARGSAACSGFTTTLYELIAAVGDAVVPDAEVLIAPIVLHVLHAGHARFLRDIDAAAFNRDEVEPFWCTTDND